jgi:DnaK suppressor protein
MKSNTTIFVINGGREVVLDFDILRSRLGQQRKRLTEELEQIGADNRIADEHREGALFSKRGEAAAETADMRKRLAIKRQLSESLAEVEHSLHKLDDGTYGLCDNCGQPINRARIEALPQANLCLNCKVLQERRKSNPTFM